MKPEHDVGVGDGRALVAEAVAGGAGNGAGQLRPHAQQSALVDAGKRAAAGADLGDVDGGDLEHVAAGLDEAARGGDAVAELVFRRHAGPAVLDDDGLGRGAAHVEDDEIAFLAGSTQARCADHAAGRARCHHEHRLFAGRLDGREHAAVGGDDADRRLDADGARARLSRLCEIAAHGRRADRHSPPWCWCARTPCARAARPRRRRPAGAGKRSRRIASMRCSWAGLR